jgi:hypothetical protein
MPVNHMSTSENIAYDDTIPRQIRRVQLKPPPCTSSKSFIPEGEERNTLTLTLSCSSYY